MALYAIYNQNSGSIIQWLDSLNWIYPQIPQPNVSVSQAQFKNPNLKYVDINGNISSNPPNQFYIDNDGNKWIVPIEEGLLLLECLFEDMLQQTNTGYSVVPPIQITANKQISILSDQTSKSITNGYTYTLSNGQTYTFNTSITDQLNGASAFNTCQFAMLKSTPWQSNTNVIANVTVINVNNNFYICEQTGVTGKNIPNNFPTQFTEVIQDGTTAWALFGFILSTSEGNIWFTPLQIEEVYVNFVKFVIEQREIKSNLQNQINNIVNAPVVTPNLNITTNPYILDNLNNLYITSILPTNIGPTIPNFNTTINSITGSWTCLGNVFNYIVSISL